MAATVMMMVTAVRVVVAMFVNSFTCMSVLMAAMFAFPDSVQAIS